MCRLSPDGSSLLYSSYLSGGRDDFAAGIALDSHQRAYVTGITRSGDFPVTPATATDTHTSAHGKAFVTVIDTNPETGPQSLLYSSLVGGEGVWEGPDMGRDIAVDRTGNVYIVGTTDSDNFPITESALQIYPSGGICGFVSAFHPPE